MRLSATGLAVVRGDRLLFDGLGFQVGPGEIIHLQGRNGVGKTSLLETLCGLRVPAAGHIEGQPGPGELHWLGHRNGINPVLTPHENLRFWCALHGAASADIDAALSRAGLRPQRRRPCGQLSTGQKRRAALARLIAAPRRWWFLDEPLAGLDAAGLELFAEMIEAHLGQGGAAVVTSHQPLPLATARARVLTLESLAPRPASSPS